MPPKLNPSTKKAKEAPPTNRGSPAKKKKAHTAPPAKKKAHTTPPAKKKAHTTPPAKKKVEKRTRKQQPKQPKRQGYRNGSAVTWNDHLARYRNANNCTLKQAMVLASPSWMEAKYGSQSDPYLNKFTVIFKVGNLNKNEEKTYSIQDVFKKENKSELDYINYALLEHIYLVARNKTDKEFKRKWTDLFPNIEIAFYEKRILGDFKLYYNTPDTAGSNTLSYLNQLNPFRQKKRERYVLIRLVDNTSFSTSYPLMAYAYEVNTEYDNQLIEQNILKDEYELPVITKDNIKNISTLLLDTSWNLYVSNPASFTSRTQGMTHNMKNINIGNTFMKFFNTIKDTLKLVCKNPVDYQLIIQGLYNDWTKDGSPSLANMLSRTDTISIQ